MQEHTDWTLAEPTGREWFDWRDVVVFDCEANGLLDKPDYRFHCAWLYDMASREYKSYRLAEPGELARMLDDLKGRVIVAHNGLGYDYQAIDMEAAKAGLTFAPKLRVDSLVLCRMLWAVDDLLEPDAKLWRQGRLPGNLMKGQSIEAWGYRLGEMKGDYSKEMKAKGLDPWANFNEDMFAYNKQDVTVNLKLLLLILKKLGWFQPVIEGKPAPYSYPAAPVETEHEMQRICLKQELRGLGFDRDKAVRLAGELANQRAALEEQVSAIFKPWWQPSGDTKRGTIAPATVRRRAAHLPMVSIRRWSDKTGKELAPEFNHPWATTEVGAAFVPVKYTEFSLSNRHHLANRLQAVFGWRPKAFGGRHNDEPVIDEATIKAIPDGVLAADLKQAILDYYVINKTYATLASGANAWLRLYDEDTGTIHGRCNPLGTITHRAAHDKPNLGNIPSVELDEEKDASGKVISKTEVIGIAGGFGHECRELFGPASPFDCQTGTDAYALEVFLLAHYIAKFDDGALVRKLDDPNYDIHQDNANICELPRKDVKTTFYKTLYGSGALDVGRDTWKPEDDDAYWAEAPGVKSWMNWNRDRLGDAFRMPSKHERALYGKGKYNQNRLLNGVPGLKDLIKDLKARAKEHGYIIAIDRRKLSVRKEFAALNALLQGSGSIACKVWIRTLERMLIAKGLMPSILEPGTGRIIEARDWNQIAWVHDETQNEHHKSLGDVIGKTSQEAIAEASRILGLRATLRADFKVGANWAVCH